MQVVDSNGRLKVEITSTVDDLSIGVTTISGGTNGRVLYDNAGILGEIAGTSSQFIKGNGSLDSNTYLTSAVTSVGLSMPSAFSVANSPVTTSGTIAVTGAGVASQYIRGDGSLANFPTSTGGGASVSYYLNGSVSQGTLGGVAYKEMNSVPIIGAGTDFSINADGYIAQFITDVGDPNKLLIPAGNWNFETYFNASSSGGSPRFYIELYKYNGTTFTLIASNSATPENITGGTAIDLYFTALAVPSTALLATDRLAVRFYVIHSGRTITMHTENSHLSQIITTFSTGLTALNGLSSQVQYLAVGATGTDFNISSATDTHTFNLPTASATNRGALSSTDWTTFNGKQPLLVSGTNIKTVNSTSILGSGDISVGVTSVTASLPLLSSGGSTPNITIFQASAASSGYLSATDWLTFNGKQAALVSGGNIKTINGTTLLGSGDLVVGGSSAIAIGTTAITSGTVGRVLFEGTGNVVQESANLFWDNTNGRLGIGTSSPAYPMHLAGLRFAQTGTTLTADTTLYYISDNLSSVNNSYILFGVDINGGTVGFGSQAGTYLSTGKNGTGTARPLILHNYDAQPIIFANNNAERMRIAPTTGNLLINTTTDAGYKLDVNGTARVSGSSFNATTSGTLVSGTTTIVNMNYGEVPKTYLTGGTFIDGTLQLPTTLRVMATGGGIQFQQQSAPSANSILSFGNNSSGVFFGNFSSLSLKFLVSNIAQMTIASTGNVLINTTTDAGFKLDVNGTARVVTKVVTPILEGVSSGRVDLKYGFGTSTPSSNILSVGYGGEPAILIGSGTTQNSSMIQMNSTTQGFLPPRMTTTQKNAIASPATGLMVYDTTLNVITYYNGTTWI